MDNWIKCIDRMPIKLSEVRVYKCIEVIVTDGKLVTAIDCAAGIPNGDEREFWCEFSRYGEMKPEDITHWMPMPAPPEK